MRTNELMLYKNMDFGGILNDMTFLMENYESVGPGNSPGKCSRAF